jgi:hypothetical protein
MLQDGELRRDTNSRQLLRWGTCESAAWFMPAKTIPEERRLCHTSRVPEDGRVAVAEY